MTWVRMVEDKPDFSKVDMTVYSDELVVCIKTGAPMKTNSTEFIRRYIKRAEERRKILDNLLGITRDEN